MATEIHQFRVNDESIEESVALNYYLPMLKEESTAAAELP